MSTGKRIWIQGVYQPFIAMTTKSPYQQAKCTYNKNNKCFYVSNVMVIIN